VLLSVLEFIGHLHPLLVHLPIGILLAGILLYWISGKEKYKPVRSAVPVILLWGVISAAATCITGWLLSLSDEYDKTLLGWHQWMGISVAFFSLLLFIKIKNPLAPYNEKILAGGILLLIFITGHLGGSLTHGSDYLTKPLADIFEKDSVQGTTIKPLANVQEAAVYNDVVKPIFQTRCYSCHGARKQKGKLRVDDSLLLMKGGKDGKVIESGNADGSELLKRLLLPVDNEDHMPPKEKPQPTESQIELIRWWISQGANFEKKVKDISQSEKIKPLLSALQKEEITEKMPLDLPTGTVDGADKSVMEKMKQRGIVVLPVAQNNNWVMVNLVTDKLVDRELIQWLLALRKQLVWLKLDDTNLSDTSMDEIGQLVNLRRLSLQKTKITDHGLSAIRSLGNLQYLNLVGTEVTAKGILSLKDLKSLQSLYLYQTAVKKTEWPVLEKAFPKTRIDSGGYRVLELPTDTMLVKVKKEY
jgi:mono/diheme cytochrome c family protein/uncharacterized membrane protein